LPRPSWLFGTRNARQFAADSNGRHDDAVREMLNFVEANRTPLKGISVKQLIREGHRL